MAHLGFYFSLLETDKQQGGVDLSAVLGPSLKYHKYIPVWPEHLTGLRILETDLVFENVSPFFPISK